MVVNREPVALAIPDAVNVAPIDQHAPAARAIAAGDELEQRRLAGAVGTEKTDRAGRVDGEIRFEAEGLAPRPAGRVVALLAAIRRAAAVVPSVDPEPHAASGGIVAQL